MSRNSVYESKKRAAGLRKVTLWVPLESEIELKSMADFLCANREHIPYMARSLVTGRLKKAV